MKLKLSDRATEDILREMGFKGTGPLFLDCGSDSGNNHELFITADLKTRDVGLEVDVDIPLPCTVDVYDSDLKCDIEYYDRESIDSISSPDIHFDLPYILTDMILERLVEVSIL